MGKVQGKEAGSGRLEVLLVLWTNLLRGRLPMRLQEEPQTLDLGGKREKKVGRRKEEPGQDPEGVKKRRRRRSSMEFV